LNTEFRRPRRVEYYRIRVVGDSYRVINLNTQEKKKCTPPSPPGGGGRSPQNRKKGQAYLTKELFCGIISPTFVANELCLMLSY
jgi:hypothetical protein